MKIYISMRHLFLQNAEALKPQERLPWQSSALLRTYMSWATPASKSSEPLKHATGRTGTRSFAPVEAQVSSLPEGCKHRLITHYSMALGV